MGFSKLFTSPGLVLGRLNSFRVIVRPSSSSSALCDSNSSEAPSTDATKEEGVVVVVYGSEDGKGFQINKSAQKLDQATNGAVARAISELSCDLKIGQAFVIPAVDKSSPVMALAYAGTMQESAVNHMENLDVAVENLRWAVGAGVCELMKRGLSRIDVDGERHPVPAGEAAALASWRFQEFKSCVDRKPDVKSSLLGHSADSPEGQQFRLGLDHGESQNWARYLSDMPANKMTPVDLAQAALDMLCPLGCRVTAHDHSWITTQKMEAFLAVARGSCETPIFLEVAWEGPGSKDKPPILLAAKGVTFDSGGLCLKRAESMVENRGSMAGAAAVLAAFRYAAITKLPLNLRAVIPICENMISGQCMKVGDVVRALNGLHITIENTDMEGRLLLADALVYGQSVHKPALVVDVATCTHGILEATGGGAYGAFVNKERLWAELQRAGADSGDRPWRFPLWRYYQHQVTNDLSVDLRNKGSGRATPCLGAAFLSNFVCTDWVHLDITGVGKVAHAVAPPYLHPRRMSGRPALALFYFLQRLSKAQHPCPDSNPPFTT